MEFIGTLADLDKVLAAADVLVIPTPLTRATQNLIGDRELARMKSTAILVNVARAGIIVERWARPSGSTTPSSTYPTSSAPRHNSSIVAESHAFAARHAAENVRRYLQDESLAGTVQREDYLPT
jgi:hypothetical protein